MNIDYGINLLLSVVHVSMLYSVINIHDVSSASGNHYLPSNRDKKNINRSLTPHTCLLNIAIALSRGVVFCYSMRDIDSRRDRYSIYLFILIFSRMFSINEYL